MIPTETLSALSEFKSKLGELFDVAGEVGGFVLGKDLVECIWSFGSNQNYTNILFNITEKYNNVWSSLQSDGVALKGQSHRYARSVVEGFQLATRYGPLCKEPMTGVGFLVEELNVKDSNFVEVHTRATKRTPVTREPTPTEVAAVAEKRCKDDEDKGISDDDDENQNDQTTTSMELIPCVKEACHRAFQCHPQRLVWMMYKCVVQVMGEGDALGNIDPPLTQSYIKLTYFFLILVLRKRLTMSFIRIIKVPH